MKYSVKKKIKKRKTFKGGAANGTPLPKQVALLLFLGNNEILVLKKGDKWDLPNGEIIEKLTPFQSLKQHFMEQTTLELPKLSNILKYIYKDILVYVSFVDIKNLKTYKTTCQIEFFNDHTKKKDVREEITMNLPTFLHNPKYITFYEDFMLTNSIDLTEISQEILGSMVVPKDKIIIPKSTDNKLKPGEYPDTKAREFKWATD